MTVLHFTGHLINGPDDPRWPRHRSDLENLVSDLLVKEGVTHVFGSMACGADLLILEQALKHGVRITAFLPCKPEYFEQVSVAMGGPEERERYHRLISQIDDLRIVADLGSSELPGPAFELASRCAMNAARAEAKKENTTSVQLALWDGQSADEGTAADVNAWVNGGGRTLHVQLPDLQLREVRPAAYDLNQQQVASYVLGEEVDRAWRAAAAKLSEAAVLYGARLLEGVVRTAGDQLKMTMRSHDTFEYIDALAAARRLDEGTRVAAHVLRRAGNEVRHVQRALEKDEHWIVLSLARIMVRWYVTQFPEGPRFPEENLQLPSTPYDFLVENLLYADTPLLMESLIPEVESCLPDAPLLAAIVIEKAIDLELWDAAKRLIRLARSLKVHNRRIMELEALLFSRNHQPRRAIELLENLRFRPFDIEAPGILAGAYKRLWLENQQPGYLQKAATLYLKCWHQTQSPYLGINAAACLTWQGKRKDAVPVAEAVLEVLRRRASYWQDDVDRIDWDFFSLATMAEALLILRQNDEADEWEASAVKRAQAQGAPLDVFRHQMDLHRRILNER